MSSHHAYMKELETSKALREQLAEANKKLEEQEIIFNPVLAPRETSLDAWRAEQLAKAKEEGRAEAQAGIITNAKCAMCGSVMPIDDCGTHLCEELNGAVSIGRAAVVEEWKCRRSHTEEP